MPAARLAERVHPNDYVSLPTTDFDRLVWIIHEQLGQLDRAEKITAGTWLGADLNADELALETIMEEVCTDSVFRR